MEIPILNTAPSESVISYKEPMEWPIQFGSINNIFGNSSVMINSLDSKKDGNIIVTNMEKPVEIMPMPTTALFRGGEDDEPMTHSEQYLE